jgi:hypothetical protein
VTTALAFLLILLSVAEQSTSPPPPKESLVQKLLRIAGLTAAPSQMRAPGDPQPGDIWIVSLQEGARRALTSDGGYRSPIFSPDNAFVYAIRDDVVIRIPIAGGPATPQGRAPNLVKLVGFDGPENVVVLTEAQAPESPLAALSLKSGQLTPLPHDPKSADELHLIAFVRGDERVYGETRVYTRTERKPGALRASEWTDVYLARGTATPVNVSMCQGVDCGAPAVSGDGRYVVYIKAP